MNSSNTSSKAQSRPLAKIAAAIFIICSSIGFVDAAFLTAKHYLGGPVPCSVNFGCETVLTSGYAVVLGIPISLIGMLYYLLIVILAVMGLNTGAQKFFGWASRIALSGLIVSGYFVYLQLFVLHAICLYCMTSAAMTLIMSSSGFILLIQSRKWVQP